MPSPHRAEALPGRRIRVAITSRAQRISKRRDDQVIVGKATALKYEGRTEPINKVSTLGFVSVYPWRKKLARPRGVEPLLQD